MLQHLGAYTIDADGLSHQAMQPGAPAYKPIVETFGQFILGPDKKINRAMLGQIVFANPDALAKLEAIVHPVVRQAIHTLVTRSKQRVVVIEAIKLLEGDLASAVDTVWVVNAAPETQLRRLVEKRNLSPADAQQRVAAQNAQSDKIAKASVVIQNDGNVEETWKQTQDAWGQIREQLTRQAKAAAPTAPSKPVEQSQTAPVVPAAPTAPAPAAPPQNGEDLVGIDVKRGMPGNADDIAKFVSRVTGREITRMDIMMAFGQKSYLLARDSNANDIGVMGWQVENLITRADEFYLKDGVSPAPVVGALISAIEEASMDLQSEVSFIFLPVETGDAILQPFLNYGYAMTTVKDIKIPAWREAVQEIVTAGNETQYRILTKKLREDRVLQPL
jgi:dephospho-CoA kinase